MLIAVLADIPARLVRIIAMKIESVGSGREGFYWTIFAVTDNSFLVVHVSKI
jgi:hypothetical protein